MTNETSHPAAAYVAFYEALSSTTVSGLGKVVHEDIHFKDPFSDIHGLTSYQALLENMFVVAPDIHFKVKHCAYDGCVCFLRWTSKGTVKPLGPKPWVVEGMSELRFAQDGRVLEHIDHWDASSQFYMRIPILGRILRSIQRRVAAS